MGHLDHAALGWLTPVLPYAMACTGAALGLRCTVRALAATGRTRRNWPNGSDRCAPPSSTAARTGRTPTASTRRRFRRPSAWAGR
ncbi:hypothetical protein M6G08_29990 [Streptomyces sp. M92]|nr:hypothetical protein [Streptomyces sp. M92]WCN07331.1 hypothetical protein M6G08_29990 [Streptomyces sp. M92]